MNVERDNWNSIWDDAKALQMLGVAADKLNLPADCVKVLTQAQQSIVAVPAAFEAVKNAAVCLMDVQEDACREQLQLAAQKSGVPFITAVAVMLIAAIPMMERIYADKGLPEDLMWDTLIDVRCKLQEEYDCSGVWGTAAVGWYVRLYRAAIIKLGRLEFEPIGYKWDTPYRGVQKGDPVLNVHIPSCGGLPIEAVIDSLKRAHTFFAAEYGTVQTYVCASWLLYPPICEEVMKPDSNMKKFYDLFEVVEQYEDPENKNFWRVFNVDYAEGVLDKAPTDTSLRRGIYNMMKSGRHMGIGRCMLQFDGEKIISK